MFFLCSQCVNEIRNGGFSVGIQWHPLQKHQQYRTVTITVSVTVTRVTRVSGANKTILSIHSCWICRIFPLIRDMQNGVLFSLTLSLSRLFLVSLSSLFRLPLSLSPLSLVALSSISITYRFSCKPESYINPI